MGIAEMRTRNRVFTALIAAGMAIAFVVGCGGDTSGDRYTLKKNRTTTLQDISVTNLTPNVAKSAAKQTARYTISYRGTRKLSVTLTVTKLPSTSDKVTIAIKGANPSSVTLTAGKSATFDLGKLKRYSRKAFTPKVTLPATIVGKATKNVTNTVTLSGTATLN